MGHCPLFSLLWLALNCHGAGECVISVADVLRVCSRAQGLVEFVLSAILDLIGSNQFLSCPVTIWLPWSVDSGASLMAQLVKSPGSIPGLGRSPGEGIGYPLQYSWASLVALVVKNLPTMWETLFDLWVGKIPWRRKRLPIPIFWPGESHGLQSQLSSV